MGDLQSDRLMKSGFMSNVTFQLITAFPSTLEAYVAAYEKGASYNPVACTTAARNSALTGLSVPYV
jgi:hypothetical protein